MVYLRIQIIIQHSKEINQTCHFVYMCSKSYTLDCCQGVYYWDHHSRCNKRIIQENLEGNTSNSDPEATVTLRIPTHGLGAFLHWRLCLPNPLETALPCQALSPEGPLTILPISVPYADSLLLRCESTTDFQNYSLLPPDSLNISLSETSGWSELLQIAEEINKQQTTTQLPSSTWVDVQIFHSF